MENQMLVIFGSTGDLTKRKLIPGLYKLYSKNHFKNIPIVCVGRRNLSNDEFFDVIGIDKTLEKYDKIKVNEFKGLIDYYGFSFADENYNKFEKYLDTVDNKFRCDGNKIFYLATASDLFENIVEQLYKSNILKGQGFKRVVFEKPFGSDLKSAIMLNDNIKKHFNEHEIYRIDHYLGKELVQDIMVFRFSNSIFEQIWNNKFIDNVQIVVSEKLGVESRGEYYDKTGALRDMIQNHLLQLLSLVTMQAPKTLSADDIRDAKVKVLKKAKISDFVTAQYKAGKIDGKKVIGYRAENKVFKNSNTETFACVKAFVNNRIWRGVPFYLMTGKRLKEQYAEVNLVLKDVSCNLFNHDSDGSNMISIRIQPDEGIVIQFNVKEPGKSGLTPVTMEFCHHCEFAMATPEAYEKLLSEIMIGNQTLFTRFDALEASWKIVDKVIKKAGKKQVSFYDAGSVLPKAVLDMLAKDKVDFVKIPRKYGI